MRGRQSRGRDGDTVALLRKPKVVSQVVCLYQNQVLCLHGEDFMKAVVKYGLRGRERR